MGKTVHAFGDDALGDLDAVGIAAAIRSGEVSRIEVIDAAIDRVERVNPHINAIAYAAFERARVAAAGPHTTGPFSGVPSFVKDNNDVVGLPTCFGSAAFKVRPAKKNSPPAEQFLQQGYAILGKSTLPEFGLTASTEYIDRPPTRNPWNVDRSAGASSGGAAALVASGAVPVAHANDGGGSIRIPAAVNGLVGLKPTRARLLDQPGVRQLPVNLVGEGIVSRSVRDTAHHLAAMERTYHNRELPAVGLVEGAAKRRLRIGVITSHATGDALDPETVAVTNVCADMFADLGHSVRAIEPPVGSQFATDFKLYWGMLAVLMSASAQLRHGFDFDPRRLDPVTRGLAKMWTRNSFRTVATLRRLRAATQIYDDTFSNLDVVLSPTLSHPAPEIGYLSPEVPFDELFVRLQRYVAFTPLNNVGGGPAITLPSGMTAGNLPGSIHLSAARGDERTLLEMAYEFEEARPFPRIRAVTAAV
ncbi:amidase [Antrihabitans sp. YC2-6]|uniref:amidase n=1 Tax=Antrihabitans sp. YC2-6 TaxID=2799498 RepID=UPI0018F6CE67|nr:amidase [Antrihabitans sp. YC2-6]MBJ8348952.1 amidase [Antrihabitans sp. YC2-6]